MILLDIKVRINIQKVSQFNNEIQDNMQKNLNRKVIKLIEKNLESTEKIKVAQKRANGSKN